MVYEKRQHTPDAAPEARSRDAAVELAADAPTESTANAAGERAQKEAGMKTSVVAWSNVRTGRRSKRWSRLHCKLGRASAAVPVVVGLLATRLFEVASAELKGAASGIEGVGVKR